MTAFLTPSPPATSHPAPPRTQAARPARAPAASASRARGPSRPTRSPMFSRHAASRCAPHHDGGVGVLLGLRASRALAACMDWQAPQRATRVVQPASPETPAQQSPPLPCPCPPQVKQGLYQAAPEIWRVSPFVHCAPDNSAAIAFVGHLVNLKASTGAGAPPRARCSLPSGAAGGTPLLAGSPLAAPQLCCCAA